jgi:hypothetical protein
MTGGPHIWGAPEPMKWDFFRTGESIGILELDKAGELSKFTVYDYAKNLWYSGSVQNDGSLALNFKDSKPDPNPVTPLA